MDSDENIRIRYDYKNKLNFSFKNKTIKNSFLFFSSSIRNSKNYYEVLGVSESFDEKELERMYRKRAFIVHPDKCKSTDAKELFQGFFISYRILLCKNHFIMYY
jgi:hypothetical protein